MAVTARGSAELWTAISEKATAWRASTVVARVSASLPRNANTPGNGLPHLLLNLDTGRGWINRPLRLPSLLALSQIMQPPEYEQVRLTNWYQDLLRLEAAHRLTVAWIRARLPGYPMIPAPQLTRGSALTTREVPVELDWDPAMLPAGLQFVDPVSQVTTALELTDAAAAAVDQAARDVVAALQSTQAWIRYASALTALDAPDRAALTEVMHFLAIELRPDRIDEYEPHLLLPRYDYRKQLVTNSILTLSGPAREFADAFGGIDDLITTAASDVFGQLLFHKPLHVPARNVERHLDDPSWVSFETDFTGFHLGPSVVCRVDDPTLLDLVLVQGEQHFVDTDAWTVRIAGRVLSDSAHLR